MNTTEYPLSVRIFTIGFAETSAADFFTLLRRSDAKRVLDVRLNNTSQLSGFTKRDDLRFFLREICQMEYHHLPELAPTQELLDAFKKHKGTWHAYERGFLDLMAQRAIETSLSPNIADLACLLCSEKRPEQCHRRLVAEYLRQQWGDVAITHLT